MSRPLRAAALWLLLGVAGAAAAFAAGAEPAGWVHVPINDRKPRTQYEAVAAPDGPQVHARAARSASLLMQPAAGLDLARTPWVQWRWRLLRAPADADIAVADREDAAARLVFVFDGDRSRLPWTDRAVMAAADRLGSRPMPYATLMYVHSDRHPPGSIVANPYTRRLKMVVVDAQPVAAAGAGEAPPWRSFARDLVADYRRAFGEAPGPLVAWGLMSDSDNTRSAAEAFYTLPRFTAGPPPAAP